MRISRETLDRSAGLRPAAKFAIKVAQGGPQAILAKPNGCGSQSHAPERGFTMIEIALCLGIIGFALVAIIGALPTGLRVQKDNREQTIVAEDAQLWMDSIRSGALGFDDLTNYVLVITNQWTTFNGNPPYIAGSVSTPTGNSGADWYTNNNSSMAGVALTNGATIIGLLSTPTWTAVFPNHGQGDYQSNYVFAYVRAISGAEVDKVPQNNQTILADAFTYRMVAQNFPYAAANTNDFCMNCPGTNGLTPAEMAVRANLAYEQMLLQTNAHDLRLLFRWPVLPNGQIGNGGNANFRLMANGQMIQTNYPNVSAQWLYYVQPSIYAQLPTNHSAIFLP